LNPTVTEPLAFSADQVFHLTGLSLRQLGYWDQTGFYAPRYADDERGRPYSRIYSFQDVVRLRTLAVLRNKHHIPLQELRRVSDWLKERYQSPWVSLKFFIAGKKILFDEPESGTRITLNPPGQTVFAFAIREIIQEIRTATDRLRNRSAEDLGRVVRHRYLVHNAPVLAGTRIPTTAVWTFHQAGYTPEQILREYPRLTPQDVAAAIAYEQPRQKRAS